MYTAFSNGQLLIERFSKATANAKMTDDASNCISQKPSHITTPILLLSFDDIGRIRLRVKSCNLLRFYLKHESEIDLEDRSSGEAISLQTWSRQSEHIESRVSKFHSLATYMK